jgi:hypothetical protein
MPFSGVHTPGARLLLPRPCSRNVPHESTVSSPAVGAPAPPTQFPTSRKPTYGSPRFWTSARFFSAASLLECTMSSLVSRNRWHRDPIPGMDMV